MKTIFSFTFLMNVQMLECEYMLLKHCETTDGLDYQIIRVLIYVINEVFLHKLRQDHSLLSLALVKQSLINENFNLFFLMNYVVKSQYSFQ